MDDQTPEAIRRRLERDLISGAYVRNEGPLREKGYFNSRDMEQASSYYNLRAAYTPQGFHWRLILSFHREGNGYRASVYDPLAGVTEMTVKPERGIPNITFSHEMDRLYLERRAQRGVTGISPEGYRQGMSMLEFLVEYFERNSVPQEAIQILSRRGVTQRDGYNCGPLAVLAAKDVKNYLGGSYINDRLEIGTIRKRRVIDLEESAAQRARESDTLEIGEIRKRKVIDLEESASKRSEEADTLEVGKWRKRR